MRISTKKSECARLVTVSGCARVHERFVYVNQERQGSGGGSRADKGKGGKGGKGKSKR